MEVRDFSVSTPDGRRLAARISGPAEGPVVLYFGGTPGAIELYERQVQEGERRGLRHLIYLRPGYFGSDRLPGRSVADCAADAASVLDEAGVEKAFVVGHSGGGGHAAACATLLPDRIRSGAVLSSFSPPEGMKLDAWLGEEAGAWNKEEFAAIEGGDARHREFIVQQAEEMREIRTGEDLNDTASSLMSQADSEALLEPSFLAFQLKCYPLAVRGGVDGWFDDNKAVVLEDWGFDLQANRVPVTIWHGDDDRTVPYSHGERFEARMANARLKRLTGEGHFSYLVTSYGPILDDLLEIAG